MRSDVSDLAAEVLALTLSRPPTLGAARLLCIDGFAGTGKTTLAAEVLRLGGGHVLHLDDFYPGWRGLDEVGAQVEPMLGDLAAGIPGHYRRWDWDRDAFVEDVTVEPVDLLVLEGVGSGQGAWAHLITALVWLRAPQAVRLQRGLERDGAAVRDQWIQWQDDERALLAREHTDQRADVVVDTSG
ncbi:4-amino-4-deoxy-L-arabinose transferase [Nocardioides seonyuensis]|uniref:4-amino-4-deoxy-L-arabinose transferase n=1 Tax=Nocardioides seonyuensis TaxID=2518371 RepID=A0A4P7II29_9ACTN|nr:4-amino-4-deoxy-L-arabinose transferase [Nocardioides seonyuensis]QBX56985.1 4-amino-4-deoxy-L-arabinose transferase [Nocardioides seonyuensis]